MTITIAFMVKHPAQPNLVLPLLRASAYLKLVLKASKGAIMPSTLLI
jgi:hypothetical protein